MEKRRVVITGLGAITPLGLNAADSWAAAKAGKCGIDTITLYDHSAQKVHLAAEAHGFAPEDFMEKKEARKMDRFTQFALAAANEAMANSGLDMAAEDAGRCGVLVSSGIGGLSTPGGRDPEGRRKGFDRVSPFYIPMSITNLAAGHIAIRHGFKGMCSCVVAACAGGSNAVGTPSATSGTATPR